MNRKSIVLTLTVLAAIWAAPLFAAAPDACQNALREQVLQNNPKAGSIVFHPEQATEKQMSAMETVYEGTGEFRRESGESERLTWQCTYNPRQKTVVDAKYSVTSDAPESPETIELCQSAIRDRIHKENQGSGAVTFTSSKPSRMSNKQNLLEGMGNVVIKGKSTNFKYRCVYNVNGNLTEKTYEMQ